MSGNKEFGVEQDYPQQSPGSGKPILTFDREAPAYFTDLLDTIVNYTGHAGKYIVVNASESGLTVTSASSLDEAAVQALIDASFATFPLTDGTTAIISSLPLDMDQNEIMNLRLEQLTADPASPVNGQIWYNTSDGIAKGYFDDTVMSFYSADDAQRLTDVEVLAASASSVAASAALAIGSITNDNILSKNEKPVTKLQYDIIIAEQGGIDDLADYYSIVAEKTAYDNAVTALTAYLTGLNPAYTDFTQDTVIVGTTFRTNFLNVSNTRQTLLNAINELAKDEIDAAAGVASAAVPTADAAAAAAHAARTQTVIDGGMITTGRLEVGDGNLGDANAGITGLVTGTPATDIRFWAGATYANRATAPFRVQNDGTAYATAGQIGGWDIDTDSIYHGTKHITDGFSPSGITMAADGSIHATKFCINADGTISFESHNSVFETEPIAAGTLDGTVVSTQAHIPLSEQWVFDFDYQIGNKCSNDGTNYVAIDTGFNHEPPNASYWEEDTDQPTDGIETITLQGADGTVEITCDGLSKRITYNTSLTQTAADFVTLFAAAWLALGKELTSDAEDIVFTSPPTDHGFSGATTIENISSDNQGTVKLAGNEIWENSIDDDTTGIICINKRGYNGGITRNKGVKIYDGKGAPILVIEGNGVSPAARNAVGIYALSVLMPWLPTSNAGLGTGAIYRDGAGADATLKIK